MGKWELIVEVFLAIALVFIISVPMICFLQLAIL